MSERSAQPYIWRWEFWIPEKQWKKLSGSILLPSSSDLGHGSSHTSQHTTVRGGGGGRGGMAGMRVNAFTFWSCSQPAGVTNESSLPAPHLAHQLSQSTGSSCARVTHQTAAASGQMQRSSIGTASSSCSRFRKHSSSDPQRWWNLQPDNTTNGLAKDQFIKHHEKLQ